MGLNVNEARLREVISFFKNSTREETLKVFGLKPESLDRYFREAKNRGMDIEGKSVYKSAVLDKIAERFTDKELDAIAEGGRLIPGIGKVPIISFEGERIRFTLCGDIHFGSLYTDPNRVYKMFEESRKEGSEFIAVGGDVCEGMSNRPGHIYELSHLGYEGQKEHAEKVLGQWDKDMFLIDGNHDRWYIKSSGAHIVRDICSALGKRFTFLGHDEGDISLKGKATIKMWHGEDGSSYAISYRVQKIIESLTGGTKPGILSCHHVHKFNYIFERHIHAISPGCIQSQTKWMRGKRLSAHTGFCIVDAWVNKDGIAKIKLSWYPYYS
jgi:hypothetical protein